MEAKYGLTKRSLKYLTLELKLRGYSQRTISDYIYHNNRFLKFIRQKPHYVTGNDVKEYLEHLIDKGQTENSTNKVHSALKFYYSNFLKRKFFNNIPRRKNHKRLPDVLSKNNIVRMIDSINNPKHKLLVELLYGSGLRISECLSVRIQDFNLKEKTLLIKKGKGKKDRIVILSKRFIQSFKNYVKNESGFLFEGRNGRLSVRSAQEILKTAKRKINLKKRVYPHALRASYATHMIQNGSDVTTVQKLMGHSDIRNTQRYIRPNDEFVNKSKSPLDD